jgi:hypothetical protein
VEPINFNQSGYIIIYLQGTGNSKARKNFTHPSPNKAKVKRQKKEK